jgi:hypothetical protein
MAKLKLRVIKVKNINLQTKKEGRVARVLTNGTADYSDIAEDAAEDTTFNVDEIRAASGIFIRAAAKALKQGFIVDLGPLGKIYPSCTSGWFENAEDLTMDSVKPTIYYRPSQEVEAAIKGASLVWAKAGEAEDAEQNGTVSPSTGDDTTGGGSNSGGDGNGGGDDPDNGME